MSGPLSEERPQAVASGYLFGLFCPVPFGLVLVNRALSPKTERCLRANGVGGREMLRSGIVVVSRRASMRRQLSLRLGRLCHADCEGLRELPDLYALPPGAPRLAIIDVLELVRRLDCSLLPNLPLALPLLAVIGFRHDSDAILAVLNEGVPVHVLEDMATSALAQMVGEGSPVPELYDRMGRLCAERVHRFLLRNSVQPALTRREAEILELVRAGCPNSEIAQLLKIDLKTVKNHLTHVYEKLGVSGRHEAIVRFPEPRNPAVHGLPA